MSRLHPAVASAALLAAFLGCDAAATDPPPPGDAGVSDAGASDAGASDAGASDAGASPSGADGGCDPTGPHDATTFTFTATCAAAGHDGGEARTCAEWSEGAEGDWTPFAESCLAEGGTLETTPCPEAGLGGLCTLPATCTTQTTLFYYGTESEGGAQAACEASGGSFTP